MIIYLRSAELWNGFMAPLIENVGNACKYKLSFPPTPHAVASTSPIPEEVQMNLAIDVIYLGGQLFLHCIDRVTGWSEAGLLCIRDLSEQVRILCRIQILRHVTPHTILSDREYGKWAFNVFFDEQEILLSSAPAHSRE